jgi:hypothetical protein
LMMEQGIDKIFYRVDLTGYCIPINYYNIDLLCDMIH